MQQFRSHGKVPNGSVFVFILFRSFDLLSFREILWESARCIDALNKPRRVLKKRGRVLKKRERILK